MAKKDLQFSIGVLVLCALMYIGTFSIKITKTVSVSAAFFPRIILGVTAVLAVIYMIFALRALKNNKAEEKKQEKGDIKRLLTTIGLFIVYGIVVDIIGFMISSIIFLIIQMWVMLEVKNKKELIRFSVISVVSMIIVYYVFNNLFFVSLPTGRLF